MNDNYDDLYKSNYCVIKLSWQETPTSEKPTSSTNSSKTETKTPRTSPPQSESSSPPKWSDSATENASRPKFGTQVHPPLYQPVSSNTDLSPQRTLYTIQALPQGLGRLGGVRHHKIKNLPEREEMDRGYKVARGAQRGNCGRGKQIRSQKLASSNNCRGKKVGEGVRSIFLIN